MEKKELTGNTAVAQVQDKAAEAVVTVTEESTTVQTASGKEKTDEKQAAEAKEALVQETIPEVFLQYREYEVTMEAVTKRAKAHYYAKGYKEGSIEDIQIYVKPEDFTAYYVINDGVVGKVNLF